jgi:hypothetical protein
MSISVTHPEVAAQWHPSKNGNMKSEDYTSGSGICATSRRKNREGFEYMLG